MQEKLERDNWKSSRPLIILCVVLVAFMSWSGCNRNAYQEDSFYLGGIQVNEPNTNEWVTLLKDVGMNTVSVTVYARQGIWNSDNIWWNEQDESVVHEIRAAKKQGLKVVFIPRVTLDHYFEENSFLWHGMTMPETDNMLTNWFHWYTIFVDKWAKVCEAEGVDVMAIGSEMRVLSATQAVTDVPELESYYLNPLKQEEYIDDRMQYRDMIPPEDLWVRGKDTNYSSLLKYLEDEVATKVKWAETVAYADSQDPIAAINDRKSMMLAKWYELIATVRESYNGKLTYAANFDNYQNVAFWDKLDFIGINAYFKLRDYKPNISEDNLTQEFQKSWDNIFMDLERFRLENSLEQKALFTELGYLYKENSTIMPWEGFGFSIAHSLGRKDLLVWSKQKVNPNERRLAVEALYNVNKEYKLLNGILYWKLTTKEYHIPYEPFVLHIKKEGNDPLQESLVRFLEL